MVSGMNGLGDHIVNVNFHSFPQLVFEQHVDQVLIVALVFFMPNNLKNNSAILCE